MEESQYNLSSINLDELHRKVIERFEYLGISQVNSKNLLDIVDEILNPFSLPKEAKEVLAIQVEQRMLGLGPITEYLADEEVSEIMVNGTVSLYIEKDGQLISKPNTFTSNGEILQLINKIVSTVGRRIDTASPMVDARLLDGSRVNAIIEPLSLIGPTLTIRKFKKNPPTLLSLLQKNTLNQAMFEYLTKAILERKNIVVSGGTGSGKTTTLNALAGLISEQERLITIEDSAELKINHPHLISLESRPQNLEGKGEVSVRTLLKNSLRMRPDRIIVGEIRSGESLDMLQAMNTGHPGSLTTVHANTPSEALLRIESLALMSELELPLFAIREQIRAAIDIVIQQERLSSGERKIVAISEILKEKTKAEDSYTLRPIFSYDKKSGEFKIHE